jgi:hypothetical protein
MTPKTQVGEAIKELKRFQEVRSKSETDDSDELLNQAKLKEGEFTAAAAAAAAPPPAPPPAAGGDAGAPPPPGDAGAPPAAGGTK